MHATSLLPDVPGHPPAQQDGGHSRSRQTGPEPGRAASVWAGGGEHSPLLPSTRHPVARPSRAGQGSSHRPAQARAPGEPAVPPPPADVSRKWGGAGAGVLVTGPFLCRYTCTCENMWGCAGMRASHTCAHLPTPWQIHWLNCVGTTAWGAAAW